jgi:HrpA-like RNA helicase
VVAPPTAVLLTPIARVRAAYARRQGRGGGGGGRAAIASSSSGSAAADAESVRLQEDAAALQAKPQEGAAGRIQAQRGRLPAAEMRALIVSTIAQHQVVVISGSTGCGKTTQVPQFILEVRRALCLCPPSFFHLCRFACLSLSGNQCI